MVACRPSKLLILNGTTIVSPESIAVLSVLKKEEEAKRKEEGQKNKNSRDIRKVVVEKDERLMYQKADKLKE